MIGRTVSHYRILAELGRGGMGVVYKAQDAKLGRTVALKFLRADVLDDGEMKARFLREAQAAAALNHPNICTVYEIDENEGNAFIAMEWVEGQSIREKIRERPLELEEAIEIALQAGRGLQTAHEKGITHRDIKSANLMLTAQGQVKIMDFGLAQLGDRGQITKTGTSLGTPAYMSPEQAEGGLADRRSDIWSLGVVLYEMVTGRLPFAGKAEAALVYAILHQEPEPLTALRSGVPLALDRVIGKALAKDPGERYQHADELLVDLRVLQKQQASGTGGEPVTGRPRRRIARYAAAAGLAVVLAAGGAWISRFVGGSERPPEQVLEAVPLTSFEGSETSPAFSPDGNQVVFSWNGESRDNFDIYVQVIGSGSPLRLTKDPAMDTAPAWSPDGRYIAFIRSTGEAGEGAVYLIPPLGGAERKLAEGIFLRLNEWWPAKMGWSGDGKTLFLPEWDGEAQGIYGVDVESGDKRRLTSPPPLGDYSLAVSPDGQTLAFGRTTATLTSALYVVPVRGGDPRRLAPMPTASGSAHLAWMPSGKDIVFASAHSGRSPSLWKIAAAGGTPSRLAILGEGGSMPVVSPSGRRLVYVRSSVDINIWRYDRPARDGASWQARKLIASTSPDMSPQVSPDGRRIVFSSMRSGDTQIWVAESDGSNPVQLTYLGPHLGSPRWSPDGRTIVFDCRARGSNDIYLVNFQGGPPRVIVGEQGDQSRPSWSQDGKWIYFASGHTGTKQIWKAPAAGGKPIQLTRQGGDSAFESGDSRFVYYARTDRREIWRVPVQGGDEEVVVAPPKAFRPDHWDLALDGIYFAVEEGDARSGTNWVMKFYQFATQKVTVVTRLERPLLSPTPLDVSPDGKWFVCVQNDRSDSDLMLVENFR